MKIERDWREVWIDEMGLIVALSGEQRFSRLREFKRRMNLLPQYDVDQLKESIRLRFTPTNGETGCQSAAAAVMEVRCA